MAQISVITGVRFKPEQLIERLNKKKKYSYLSLRQAAVLYSPCWVFEFRVELKASKHASRYAGYYAGVDEVSMAPGKILLLPKAEAREVSDCQILKNKATEEEAVRLAWEYNKKWITIKYKSLYAPPVLEQYKLHFYHKILYVIEFYNRELADKKYMVLDSLTGDLDRLEAI